MEYPNINHTYKTSSFDKDVGWSETIHTIEQQADRVTITVITTENGTEIERTTDSGIITKMYDDKNLIQITLDTGNRAYYDIKKKELNNSAELIFKRSSLPGFDYKNPDHIRVICRHLHSIALVFDENIFLPNELTIIWSQHENVLQGILGGMLRFDVSLFQYETGMNWFGLWITVDGLPSTISIRSHIRREGDENWDIVVKCPPEWHEEVNKVIGGILKDPFITGE